MHHVILFCYMLSILIGVSVITIQWLANKKNPMEINNTMKNFIFILLFMNFFDLMIYYNEYMLKSLEGVILIRTGDCIIAVIVYLWTSVQHKVLGENKYEWILKASHIYIIIYIVTWVITASFFGQVEKIKFLYLFMDILLLLLMVISSGFFVYRSIKLHNSKYQSAYFVIVSVMMFLNYITYFTSELGIRWSQIEYMEGPLNITIIYWFVINIANYIIMYNIHFKNVYLNDPEKIEEVKFDIEKALLDIKEQYDLTAREVDLVREIHEGKSNQEIAEKLFISESTVKTHIYNIFRKMEVKNRVEVVCALRKEKINK